MEDIIGKYENYSEKKSLDIRVPLEVEISNTGENNPTFTFIYIFGRLSYIEHR